MASNTRRQRVGKPTGNTLKQIDDTLAWLVESMQDNYIKAGEFTAEMAHAKVIAAGVNCTLEGMRSRLSRLEKKGGLTKRSVLIDGKFMNVYLRVKGVKTDI